MYVLESRRRQGQVLEEEGARLERQMQNLRRPEWQVNESAHLFLTCDALAVGPGTQ